MMGNIKKRWFIFTIVFSILLFSSMNTYAKENTINVTITESVLETVAYNPDMGEYTTGNATWNWSYQLQDTTMTGVINITNVGSEDVVDLNITFNGTDFLIAWPSLFSAPAYLTGNGGPVPRNNGAPGVGEKWWVYATVLKAGDSIIYNYSMSLTDEPVNVTETYSVSRIIEGGTFRIDVGIENSLSTPVNISNVKVIKTPGGYYNQNGDMVYFNYSNLAGADSVNAQLLPYAGAYTQLIWNVSNLQNITPAYLGGNQYNISFDVTVPSGLNGTFPTLSGTWDNTTWGAYMLIGEMLINMTTTSSMTMFEIENVLGHSTARLDVTKERLNETHWNTSVNFNNTASSIDYNLTKITIWSTNFTAGAFDPDTNRIGASEVTLLPNVTVANGSSWLGVSQSFAWDWIPIVWSDAVYKILDDGTQIQKITETKTIENGYWYIEEIYVLKGGYLIKVTKEINPITNDQNAYNVTVLLENIGTEKTPDWVSMFDLVPSDFQLTDADDPTVGFADRDFNGAGNRYNIFQPAQLRGINQFASIAGGPYNGYRGYRADFFEIMNGSNGDGVYDNTDSEVLFQYILDGTGNLSRVGNAFLVGIDPQRTDGQVSSTNAPDTNLKLESEKSSSETAITLVSLVVALAALIGGLVLKKK